MSKKKSKYQIKQKEPMIFTDPGSFSMVPEMKVTYERNFKKFLGNVKEAKDVAKFLRSLFERGEIEKQEQFIVLYLNSKADIIGYYKHSIGTTTFSIADIRMVLGLALKSLSTAIILCHNHPSGSLIPSKGDIKNTREFIKAGAAQQIDVVDHVIVTKRGFKSMLDAGLMEDSGLSGYEDKRQSLDEFFTPKWVAEIMVQLAYKHGYTGDGDALEPSFGQGVFFDILKERGVSSTKFTGFEIFKSNFDIVRRNHPKATLYNTYFEYSFLRDKDISIIKKFDNDFIKPTLKKSFKLIIGNPPYGNHGSPHAYLFDKGMQVRAEGFFIYLCSQLLDKDGVLVFILPSLWLNNKKLYNKQKEAIDNYLTLVDAYRLPSNIFEKTTIATDILVFKKK